MRWREEALAAEPIRILRWSPVLRERLITAPTEAGRIHSVFERALNILWHDGGLVTLHGPGPLAAPFAAAVTRLPLDGSLTPGTTVSRRGNTILLGPCLLDIEGDTLVDTTIHPTDDGPGPLPSALTAVPMSAVAPGLSSQRGQWAQCRMTNGIRNRDNRTFVQGACALVGLGEGLTPAGDDCLVGILAVLHRFARPWFTEHPEIRGRIATAARAGTTLVGREFILHALDGSFSEVIFRLLTAASASDARRAAADLAKTGGTSGADTLHGIRLALQALESCIPGNHAKSIHGPQIFLASGACDR